MAWWCAAATLLLATTLHGPAQAHKSSDAYLTIESSTPSEPLHAVGAFGLRVDVALRDIEPELELDADGDAVLRWREVKERWRDIDAYVARQLQWRRGASACRMLSDATPRLNSRSDGTYAELRYVVACEGDASQTLAPQTLALQYSLFTSIDADHRGLLRLRASPDRKSPDRESPDHESPDRKSPDRQSPNDAPALIVLEPGQTWHVVTTGHQAQATAHAVDASRGLALERPSAPGSRFVDFVRQGTQHLVTGPDHMLFLALLMLVVVLRRHAPDAPARLGLAADGPWRAETRVRAIAIDVLRIVTAFTVAHSVTLTLAAGGWVSVPSRWIETLIALSVTAAALDNVFARWPMPRWLLAGGFGWVHGFGFAGPLQELGLSGSEIVVPLLGFNLGVELGQLLIVAVLLPVLLWTRHQPAYRRMVMPALSWAGAVLGGLWAVDRILDIGWL